MAATESIELVYRNIRFLRQANHLTQNAMAGILDISVGSLRKMERGMPVPSVTVDVLWKIRDAFGVSPSALMSLDLQQMVCLKDTN